MGGERASGGREGRRESRRERGRGGGRVGERGREGERSEGEAGRVAVASYRKNRHMPRTQRPRLLLTYREELPRTFLPLGERHREMAGRWLQAPPSRRWLRRQVATKSHRGPAGGSVVQCRPAQQSVAGSIHGRGAYERQPVVSLSLLSPSPFLSL